MKPLRRPSMSPVNDVEEATSKLISLGWSVVCFIVAILAAIVSFSNLGDTLVQAALGAFALCLILGIGLLFSHQGPFD